MRKRTILLIIIIIGLSYYIKFSIQSAKANPPTITQNTSTQVVDFEKIQKRQDELKKLQNPRLIENSLKQVGKLTTLEGQYNYISDPVEKGIFNIILRQIHIDFLYRWGIGINLENVKVIQIVSGRIVYIKIPKNKIQLQYIEMVNDQSSVTNGKKFFLASQFKPSETDIIINQCQANVANKIGSTQSYFELAEKNLENELDKFIKSLGYSQVIFL